MPVPQPGQGTTPLASGREDADVVVGQTTPMLSPGPTPATGDAQGQQDQARLSMALEKLVALLQRDAGGDGNDRDNDETESGENYSPSSMWREEPSGGGGQGHERHAASSLPAGLQQFGTQKEARDPLQPGQGATDKKGGVIGWLRGWLGV